jgi:hypothetical protein
MNLTLKILAAKAPWLISLGLIVLSSTALSQCLAIIGSLFFGADSTPVG